MGKIFYVMGKSASGKDTIYKRLHSRMPELKTVTMYTTRPIRDGEQNGVEYFFVIRTVHYKMGWSIFLWTVLIWNSAGRMVF